MIHLIDIERKEVAEQILSIQIPAYKVEAELIGFDGIPQLQDTMETIQKCNEVFYGYFLRDRLVGAISYKLEDEIVDIHRLIVHPDHFRKGIGRELVGFLLNEIAGSRKVIVSTGAKNLPAKRLYLKLGFEEKKDVEVASGVFITLLEKEEC